ncbi:hypothetical protein Gotur_013785 [Gossypium turneri]
MGKDREICRFRYPYFRAKPHVALVHIRLLDRKLIIEKGFLDKVEDNASVQTWSETTHVSQNSLQELKKIWDQWENKVRQLFYSNYGDLPNLLDMKVDKHLFRALAQFWNPTYSCFTFEKVDLVPTKGDSKFIPWKNLKDIILAHPDTKKRVDVFALNIYGLVVFPKALGHVDKAVTDLFDRLDKRVTLVPTILSETFRSLNACWRAGEGRFIVCVQLLLACSYTEEGQHIGGEVMAILQNLQKEDVDWRAPWLLPDEILYRCGDFDWVHLLGIRGAVGYAPLLVLKQYRSRQFIPITQGLAECEFSYKGDGYKKKIQEISNAWN